jgi:beta-lysine 5,6-aminomutase alpha subunit
MHVAMLTVPMDARKVGRCRELAAAVADDVQQYIDAHTSVGVERTILRAYGVDGVDDQGAPLVNLVVDRYAKAGVLGRGISYFLGRALLAGANDVQDAAERLAYAPELDRGEAGPNAAATLAALQK